ncbi:MAG TPA: hypothetical protein VNO50_12900 [Pyrinomonadaceae bacterium]|nr:hypothetical protein [Pyrinomonadaceae bacterium]
MKRAFFCVLLHMALVAVVAAQQPAPPPAWDVTLKTNTVADSTLTVVNRCSKNHQFQIQIQGLPFLHFSATQVNVKGGAAQLVPVKFDTKNLAPGVYEGTVLVLCQTCKSEGACTQDREVLQVILRVTAESPTTGPTAAATSPPSSPAATNQPPSNQPAAQGTGVTNAMSLDLQSLREAEAAAQKAKDQADQAAESAAQDARNAKAQAEAAPKAVGEAVKDVNKAGAAVAEAEKERDRANREGTTAERDAARAALEKAQAELEAAQKALRDAQADAAGNQQAAADEAAKKAAEKKAEADRAAAALAAAQAAVAEKEKEILKAQQEAAAAQAAKDKEAAEARAPEAKAAADKAAQEKLWAEDIERRRQEQKNREARAVEIDYLLDNIEKLGLITYKPKTNVPDPLDYMFDKLRQLAGQTVGDFLQTVAGELGGGPLPAGVIGALGEIYKGIGSFFDIRTKAGKDRALEKLQGMINPNVKPPRNYTMNEALAKIDKMEKLMQELQQKLAAAQAAAAK